MRKKYLWLIWKKGPFHFVNELAFYNFMNSIVIGFVTRNIKKLSVSHRPERVDQKNLGA